MMVRTKRAVIRDCEFERSGESPLRIDQVRIPVAETIVLLHGQRLIIPTRAKNQRQTRIELEIVLEECCKIQIPRSGRCSRWNSRAANVAEQQAGKSVTGLDETVQSCLGLPEVDCSGPVVRTPSQV